MRRLEPEIKEMLKEHIAAVIAYYEPWIGNNPRLQRGKVLWCQFRSAVTAFEKHENFLGVMERVNELTVARLMLDDKSLSSATVSYEPSIAADRSKIDFVVQLNAEEHLYVEVKTVHTMTDDSDENWEKHERRERHHTEGTHLVVEKARQGAKISGDMFSARAKFRAYALEFEPRLAAAQKARLGRGILVFCHCGGQWNRHQLKDFAQNYLTGQRSQADIFAKMEVNYAAQKGIELRRNIAAFGFLDRPWHMLHKRKWVPDVTRPKLTELSE